jgi:hypothetical protein
MIGINVQKILRELCEMKEMASQIAIAKRCGCSLQLVNKTVKMLKEKRYVHQPFRNRISVLNFQNLILYWAFNRDIENENILEFRTNLPQHELEEKAAELLKGDYAFTMFSAANGYGIKYVEYKDVFVYAGERHADKLRELEGGDKSRLFVIVIEDGHLFSGSKKINGRNLAPMSQVFVDLIGLGTWEAKFLALRFSLVDQKYPVFGARKEVEEII